MRCLYCRKVIKDKQDGFCDKNCEHLFYNYSDFQQFLKSLRKDRYGMEKRILNDVKEQLWKSWINIKDADRISRLKDI